MRPRPQGHTPGTSQRAVSLEGWTSKRRTVAFLRRSGTPLVMPARKLIVAAPLVSLPTPTALAQVLPVSQLLLVVCANDLTPDGLGRHSRSHGAEAEPLASLSWNSHRERSYQPPAPPFVPA